jgi:hypothetical protein
VDYSAAPAAAGTASLELGDSRRQWIRAVGATLSRLWVLSCELRAKSVRGYGELGAKERAFFDRQAAELEQSVEQLRSAVARSRANDGGAGR